MNKVYSLTTYKELIKRMPKEEAIKGSTIHNELDFELHLKNVQIVEDRIAKTTVVQQEPGA